MKNIVPDKFVCEDILTLLHSEGSKLYAILTFLSAIGLIYKTMVTLNQSDCSELVF